MTIFTDGPAAGHPLQLRRAPLFLRVTAARTAPNASTFRWDALDQPEDAPLPTEDLYAYALLGVPGAMHIRSGKPGASGFFPVASYKLVEPQPRHLTMSRNEAWQSWCEAQSPPQWWLDGIKRRKEQT